MGYTEGCRLTAESLLIREASHIDFVHEKRHMDVGGWGGGLAPVTFLGEKSWKISIV